MQKWTSINMNSSTLLQRVYEKQTECSEADAWATVQTFPGAVLDKLASNRNAAQDPTSYFVCDLTRLRQSWRWEVICSGSGTLKPCYTHTETALPSHPSAVPAIKMMSTPHLPLWDCRNEEGSKQDRGKLCSLMGSVSVPQTAVTNPAHLGRTESLQIKRRETKIKRTFDPKRSV